MMKEYEKQNELKAQLWGWGLFGICDVLFTISDVRAHIFLTIAASVTFLLGCVVFMIPLMKAMRRVEKSGRIAGDVILFRENAA